MDHHRCSSSKGNSLQARPLTGAAVEGAACAWGGSDRIWGVTVGGSERRRRFYVAVSAGAAFYRAGPWRASSTSSPTSKRSRSRPSAASRPSPSSSTRSPSTRRVHGRGPGAGSTSPPPPMLDRCDPLHKVKSEVTPAPGSSPSASTRSPSRTSTPTLVDAPLRMTAISYPPTTGALSSS